ncbi:MAG: ABC transporter permease [Elusimicrobiota bacterium]
MSETKRGRRHYGELAVKMALCEWKVREQSSVLGFFWTLLQPLLMFIVLYGLFTKMMSRHTPAYASFLVIGIVQYGFFSQATNLGLSSLIRRRDLIMNFPFPREIVVLASVSSVVLSYVLELVLMLALMLAFGAKVAPAWFAMPVVIVLQIVFVTGLALMLAVASARYHDLNRVWDILTRAGFFLTPIFYSLETLSPSRQELLRFNPMTHVLEATRGCLLGGAAPPWRGLFWGAMATLALAWGGLCVFRSRERSLPDDLAR